MTEITIAAAMRQGMRRLAAGVSVITLTGRDAQLYAMTVTSVTSVSDSPPSLLVCINQATRLHEQLQEGRKFAINVLAEKHKAVSVACSTGEQSQARFDVGEWQLLEDLPPTLVDSEAVFVCSIQKLFPYGTHTIVVGDIDAVNIPTAAPSPLVYLNGGYARIEPA